MADYDGSLLASALETLDIDDYWPSDEDGLPVDLDEENDGEYPIILFFYENLFDHMMRSYQVDQGQVKRAFGRLKVNYKRLSSGQNADFDCLTTCCGYLHLYAACHAGLVRKSLLELFHVSPPAAVRRLLSLKSDVRVVSLGGGPGNCMVGLCSALYGKHYGLCSLQLTVADSMAGWSFVLDDTERLLREGQFGDLSRMFREVRVSTSFVLEDLAQPRWGPDLVASLRACDVVLLVKTLSVLTEDQQTQLLLNAAALLKPGALLVYIDSPFPEASFRQALRHLEPVYRKEKRRFQFQYGVKRFGYTNITASRAHVYVFAKKFLLS